MTKLQLYPLNEENKRLFCSLFRDYYKELGCDEDCDHLLEEYVLADYFAELLSIDLIGDGKTAVGFVIYQIDDVTNEWNVREGWGDIRELYVSPSFRGKGYAKTLLSAAEDKLAKAGATDCYTLPNGESEAFFAARGYTDSGDYCCDLDCNVWIKRLCRP